MRQADVAPAQNSVRINSDQVLNYWLTKLEADGLIIRLPGRRGIDLPDDAPAPPRVPEP